HNKQGKPEVEVIVDIGIVSRNINELRQIGPYEYLLLLSQPMVALVTHHA
ncbi:6063_t:CDS:2, partial [Gigaspora rosea]